MFKTNAVYFVKNEFKRLSCTKFNQNTVYSGIRLITSVPVKKQTRTVIQKKLEEHFRLANSITILNSFPKNIRISLRRPTGFYIAHDDAAQKIFHSLQSKRDESVPFVEINPGLGLLTKQFLEFSKSQMILYEEVQEFMPGLQQLLDEYENKTSLHTGYSMGLGNSRWGSEQPIPDLKHREWHEPINCQIFGCISSPLFLYNLIISAIRQSGFFEDGRKEFFLVLPSDLYLVSDSQIDNHQVADFTQYALQFSETSMQQLRWIQDFHQSNVYFSNLL